MKIKRQFYVIYKSRNLLNLQYLPGERSGDGTAAYPSSSKYAPKLSLPRKKLLSKLFLFTKDLKLVSSGLNSPSFNGPFEIRYPISVRFRFSYNNEEYLSCLTKW